MRIVLDTNIIVSAIIYGGKPRVVHELVLNKEHLGCTSVILLAELSDVLRKKFRFTKREIDAILHQVRKYYEVVLPSESIDVLKDIPDNRVLEAAVEGECDVIVTGDKELRALSKYRTVRIVTPDEFFVEINN